MTWIGPIALILFSLLGHGYLWIGAVNRLHGWSGPRKLVDGLTLLCFLSFVAIPILVGAVWWYGHVPEHYFESAEGLKRAVSTYVWLCAALAAYKLIERALGVFPENDKRLLRSHKREPIALDENLLRTSLIGAYSRALGYLPGNEVLWPTIDRKELAIPRLPANLGGLRIVHISDLHLTGRIHGDWYRFIADEVNKLEPDLIAITGDLIEHDSCRDWLTQSLGSLRAKLGVYFILGNHDLYIDAERTVADLTSAGLTYLGGRCAWTSWNDAPILLAGQEGPWVPREPPLAEELSRAAGKSPFKLILLHTPDEFKRAFAMDADLVLAGHTHGGQVRLPLLGAVASPSLNGTRYACGTFLHGETAMHVTRGVSGETPLRWNCPPEIAVLELMQSSKES